MFAYNGFTAFNTRNHYLFDSISLGEHPDVVASERMSGADVANPECTEEAAILDAVMLSDGSLVGRDGDDCTQVLHPSRSCWLMSETPL